MAVYDDSRTNRKNGLAGAQIPILAKGTKINNGEFVVQSINPQTVILRHETGHTEECTHKVIEESMIE